MHPLTALSTIAQTIAEGAGRLRASNVAEERRTAGLLLAHVLQVSRTHLLAESNESVDEAKYQSYIELIERRAAGEPLQYITGYQEFYGLDFIVTPDVLIPRPETEFLLECILALAHEEAPLIVDIGTGSGCIAVTIAFHLPNARVIATDISGAALDVACTNAERHDVSARVDFVEGNLLEPLTSFEIEGNVDILASNPPYVLDGDIASLQREVRDWEPRAALSGGAEGLDFYRRLLVDGRNYVKRGGHLVCEIGYRQLDPISDMIDPSSWEIVEVINDLQDIPRSLAIRRV